VAASTAGRRRTASPVGEISKRDGMEENIVYPHKLIGSLRHILVEGSEVV